MNEQDVAAFIQSRLNSHGLADQGWTFQIVDEVGDGLFGYTHFAFKLISISRLEWPTSYRNVKEVILHEIAHALCGHGNHNLEWWDKLIDIGGRGVWVWDHNGSVSQARITD